ncbi:hypothetical protein Tco_0480958 [Tanacetum coccineum]
MSAGVSSGVSTGTPAGTSNKGKSPIMKVDPPVKRRTFRQMEEDRLGEETAKRFFEEEHADLERQRAEIFMKAAAFGVHAVNFLMLLQRLSPAIIRFLIQEVWSWFQDVAV